jgi:hypothetical protein
MEMEFGYYPDAFDFVGSKLKVTTLPDLTATKAKLLLHRAVYREWAFAPQLPATIDYPHSQALPYNDRVLFLPMTHRFEHPDPDQYRLYYLAWVFGFIVGMRIAPKHSGFIDNTPLKPGQFTDFYGGQKELEVGLECADALWDRHSGNDYGLRSLEGAIHALWLSQRQNLLHFEQFTYAYFAIDACWKAASLLQGMTTAGGHPGRIAALRNHFQIPDPGWPDLTAVRGDLMHEGLMSDGSRRLPLGYANVPNARDPSSSLPHEMCRFVCRVLAGLLGLPARHYIQSPINDMQEHALLD